MCVSVSTRQLCSCNFVSRKMERKRICVWEGKRKREKGKKVSDWKNAMHVFVRMAFSVRDAVCCYGFYYTMEKYFTQFHVEIANKLPHSFAISQQSTLNEVWMLCVRMTVYGMLCDVLNRLPWIIYELVQKKFVSHTTISRNSNINESAPAHMWSEAQNHVWAL